MESFESKHHVVVRINGSLIRNSETFHEEFARTFGFPEFYGCNMDAWIDCMTQLDELEAAMTEVHVEDGGMLVLQIDNASKMKEYCEEVFEAMIECAAFVNWRRMEKGNEPVLALSFDP